MKHTYTPPTITRQGSLRTVTAAPSGPDRSDARLKRDIEPYDPVLSRLEKLSSTAASDAAEARGPFEEPTVTREGSLKNVTATISGPFVG